MTIGIVRIGKVAMATIGTVWTVSNVQVLYKHTKLLFLPSSYTFLFFHVIILSILFQYSSLSSTINHLFLNLRQYNSPPNSTPQQAPPRILENQLSRSYSDIWHRIMGPESEKGNREDHGTTIFEELEQTSLDETTQVIVDKGEDVLLEEDEKDTMEDTWKAIMEGKKRAEERELKKSNTWGVSPTIEQMKGRPIEVDSSKSLKVKEEENKGQWGWRRIETVLSRDELNLRAEEFISKIKNNIRLERLESYNLFVKLINRPSH